MPLVVLCWGAVMSMTYVRALWVDGFSDYFPHAALETAVSPEGEASGWL